VNCEGTGLENEMSSLPMNPLKPVKVNVNPPWVQLVILERGKDPGWGQAAALAGAAPAKAKVPAAAKRAAPSLKRLFMIWKMMGTAAD
jgi:hypothetical protein